MFSRPPRDSNPANEPSEFQDIPFPSQPLAETNEIENTAISRMTEEEQPEIVNIVEKISKIVSPYFIVIVGLFLNEDNFFIGTILITVGILSLLKVSAQDIANFFEKIKNILGLNGG